MASKSSPYIFANASNPPIKGVAIVLNMQFSWWSNQLWNVFLSRITQQPTHFKPNIRSSRGLGFWLSIQLQHIKELGIQRRNNTKKMKIKIHIAIILVAIEMCWVAIWNGYPMVFSGDTGAYLNGGIISFENKWISIPWSRPPFYGLFTYVLDWRISLWPIVAMQALILSHLIWLTTATLAQERDIGRFIITCTFVAAFSTAPWFAGLILPDFFTSVTALGIFLLGFGRNKLSKPEYIYSFGITTLAITTHYSHTSLAIGLAATVFVLTWTRFGIRKSINKEVIAITCAITISILTVSLTQTIFSKESGFAPYKNLFILARFIGDGPALETLKSECPKKNYRLCPYVNSIEINANPYITSDKFLWDSANSPLYKIGVSEIKKDAESIIHDSLQIHFGWHIRVSIKNWITQLGTLTTGTWLEPFAKNSGDGTTKVIKEHFQGELKKYTSSRQNTEKLHLEGVNRLHKIALVVSIFTAAAIILKSIREKDHTMIALATLIISAILINSITSGVLSRPDDRYMSRLIWLIVFYASIGATNFLEKCRKPDERRFPPTD